MSDELNNTLARLLDDYIENRVRSIHQELLDAIQTPTAIKELLSSVDIRRILMDQVEAYVKNHLGNMLRCGVYGYTRYVKDAVEKELEPAVRKQAESQIRSWIRDVCRDEIKRYFEKFSKLTDQNHRCIDYELESEDRANGKTS